MTFVMADCDTNLSLGNATVMIQDGQQIIRQPYTIRREDPSNGRCSSYLLFFSKGLANSYSRKAFLSGQQASYNLHQNTFAFGTLKDVNDALNAAEYIQGGLPDEKVDYQGNFYISVPGFSSQGNLAAGIYSDNIQISVFSLANNGDRLIEEVQPWSINLIVETSLNVSLVDEGGAYDASSTAKIMNFGFLQQNQELGVDLMVDANTTYQVRLSSLNNGNLAKGTNRVAYSLRVNGVNINLLGSSSTPVSVATGSPTNATPARYNLKAKITGTTDGKPAGDYEDTITITTIAN
jgi:hypothetical protein